MFSPKDYNNPKLDEKTKSQLFILFVEEEIKEINKHFESIDNGLIILRTDLDELKKKLENSKRLPEKIKKILKT